MTKPKRDAVVYKMHGDVDHPQEAVLNRDDYESYGQKHLGFVNALVGDLTGKTFFKSLRQSFPMAPPGPIAEGPLVVPSVQIAVIRRRIKLISGEARWHL